MASETLDQAYVTGKNCLMLASSYFEQAFDYIKKSHENGRDQNANVTFQQIAPTRSAQSAQNNEQSTALQLANPNVSAFYEYSNWLSFSYGVEYGRKMAMEMAANSSKNDSGGDQKATKIAKVTKVARKKVKKQSKSVVAKAPSTKQGMTASVDPKQADSSKNKGSSAYGQCDMCKTRLHGLHDMAAHNWSVHKYRKGYVCTVPNCKRHYSNVASILDHYRLFHEILMCRNCCATFEPSNRLDFINHEKGCISA